MDKPWRLICDWIWPEPIELPLSTTLTPVQGTYTILRYSDPHTKTAIRNNKFHFHTQSAQALATVFDQFMERFPQATIIPIPSSPTRVRLRGYNHLTHITKYSRHSNYVQLDVLHKVRHTKPQSHVTNATRKKQQIGSFSCNVAAVRQPGGTVVLFDDVVTTGATMAAARASLAPHLHADTTIIQFALAH